MQNFPWDSTGNSKTDVVKTEVSVPYIRNKNWRKVNFSGFERWWLCRSHIFTKYSSEPCWLFMDDLMKTIDVRAWNATYWLATFNKKLGLLIGMKVHQLLPKHVRFFRNGVHMKCRWLFRIQEDTINLTAGEKLFGKCNFNTDTV